MAYKYGNREQLTIFPESIESYVGDSDPVRAYDVFIDVLQKQGLGVKTQSVKVGNSSYDPVAMLKVLIYSYSYGWRSSRKIERALHHNLSFMWLAGGLKPDHKTISNFRRNNASLLKQVLKRCVRLCLDLDLIEGNVLFVDGSKIRANAGNKSTVSRAKLEEELKQIDESINQLIDQINQEDNLAQDSLVELQGDLSDKEKLKSKIEKLITAVGTDKSINKTDRDCKIMKSRQGSHCSYNSQIASDDLNGLIVSAQATNAVNDKNELQSQVELAEANLEKQIPTICADSGYSSVDALKPLVDSKKTIIVPNGKQAQKEPMEDKFFDKDKFLYDEKSDRYTCPEGKQMYRSYKAKSSNQIVYRMIDYKQCLQCPHFGICTKSKKGRTINRLVNEDIKEKLIQTYETVESQEIYKRRKMKVELQFGHIKRNLNVSSFLVRGIKSVNAELNLLASCYNLRRMITLLGGVQQFKIKMKDLMETA